MKGDKKAGLAPVLVGICLSLSLGLSHAADKGHGGVKAPVGVEAPAAKIGAPLGKLPPFGMQLQPRGDKVFLKLTRKMEKVEVYFRGRLVLTCRNEVMCDISDAVETAGDGELTFVCLEAGAKPRKETLAVERFASLSKEKHKKATAPSKKGGSMPEALSDASTEPAAAGRKQAPVRLRKTVVPPASIAAPEQGATPYVSIERIYLKDDTVRVVLKTRGPGRLRREDYKRGSLSLNLWKDQNLVHLSVVDPGGDLNRGKRVDYDTGLKMVEPSTVRASITRIPGDTLKIALLRPVAALKPRAEEPSIAPGLQERLQPDGQRLERELGAAHPRVREISPASEHQPPVIADRETELELEKVETPEAEDGEPAPGTWVARGRVSGAGEGPMIGMTVRLYDWDLQMDDLLGDTATDRQGDFELAYQGQDFQELFESNPDLFVEILDPQGRRLYSSRDSIRFEAGRDEVFDVRLETLPAGSGPPPPSGMAAGSLTPDLPAGEREERPRKRSRKSDEGAIAPDPAASGEADATPPAVAGLVLVAAASSSGSDNDSSHDLCQGTRADSVHPTAADDAEGGAYTVTWRASPRDTDCEQWTVFVLCAGDPLPVDVVHIDTTGSDAAIYDPLSRWFTLPLNQSADVPSDCVIQVTVSAGYHPGPP